MSLTLDELLDAAVERALNRHLGGIREALARIESGQAPRWLTVEEAAEALSCHINTVRRMVAEGQLVYKRIGRAVRVDSRSLQGAGGELGERRAARGGRG